MTFWLEKNWQTTAAAEITAALNGVHVRLEGKSHGRAEWTVGVLQALVPVARSVCGPQAICGLKCRLDEQCKGEWIYDLSCWLEGSEPDEGFIGLPIAVESEWGEWKDIWDDLDKLTQARAGLRVLIFDARCAPDDWHECVLRRIERFCPRSNEDAWLFAGWRESGFDFSSEPSCKR